MLDGLPALCLPLLPEPGRLAPISIGLAFIATALWLSTTGLFLAATEGSAVIGVALTWLAALVILLGPRSHGSAWAWLASGSGAR